MNFYVLPLCVHKNVYRKVKILTVAFEISMLKNSYRTKIKDLLTTYCQLI